MSSEERNLTKLISFTGFEGSGSKVILQERYMYRGLKGKVPNLVMGAHGCNLNTQEAEMGSSKPA